MDLHPSASYKHIRVKSLKGGGHVTGGKGEDTTFEKNDIARGHNINQLESRGTKMADKTRPGSWISK